MNYAALRDEILTGPRAADCAPFVILPTDPKVDSITAAQNDAQIAAILSEPKPGATRTYSRHLVDMDILREWPSEQGGAAGADAFLTKLAAVAEQSGLVKRCYARLTNSRGLDFGDTQVRGMLDDLIGQAGITSAEVAAIKSLCERPASWAENSAIAANPTGADVSIALRGGNEFEVPNG